METLAGLGATTVFGLPGQHALGPSVVVLPARLRMFAPTHLGSD